MTVSAKMTARVLAMSVACLCLILGSHVANTQPAGSYQQTCRNVRMDGDTLYGSCRDIHGKYQDSSLTQVSGCVGGIFNENGALHCSYGNPPNGTYRQTCDQARIENGVLSAECRKIGSGNRYTSLAQYDHCWSDIANVDGFLACDQGDHPAPDGTFRSTCRNRMMSGTVLSAQCMNDYRDFKQTSLDTANCGQPIENTNGALNCGPPPKPPAPRPPALQGYSAVEMLNCRSNHHDVTIWKKSDQNPTWNNLGAVASSYGNSTVCPSVDGMVVQLDTGYNFVLAFDSDCGAADPENQNCQAAGELEAIGAAGGPVFRYAVEIGPLVQSRPGLQTRPVAIERPTAPVLRPVEPGPINPPALGRPGAR